MKRIIIVTSIISAGLLLSACSPGSTDSAESTPIPTVVAENLIIADGRIEPVIFVDMAFDASGTVQEVLVSEGEQVAIGQVIARLKNSEARQAEVASAEEAFLLAEQAFNNAEASALGKLADANETFRQAQLAFDNFNVPSDFIGMDPNTALLFTREKWDEARAAYEPYRYLPERNRAAKIFKKGLDNAWAKYSRAIQWSNLEADLKRGQAELEQAQEEYDSLSKNNNASEKAVAEAKYESARANLDAARAALADVELLAPFAGTIADLKVKSGESVSPGQAAVSLADFSGWIVKTTDLTELDVVNITEGQTVTIKLDAFPDAELLGEVVSIGQNYTETQGDVVYEVTVRLTETLPNMRWGMTAVVKFSE